MKRVILFTIFVLLTYIGSTAQTFTGLVDGNKWIFYCEKAINPEEYDTDYYWTQEVKGDTIIDGCTYKKVYNTITGWENENDINKPLASFFCQEDDKIYEWSNGERVLNYDFNLQAGEKFFTTYDIELIVDSVQYKSMPNNRSLKHLYVSMSEEQNLTDMWIEGVGSLTDGLNKSTIGSVGSARKLVSFVSQGVELLNNATHEYIPLLSPDNVWVESCYQAYAQYAISDRIDINGVEYCVVSRTEMTLPDKEIVANNQKVYIREEGKKVYRYDDAFAQEYLLFDFGVKEGDIIDSSISSENKRHIVVDSIRSVMLDAKEHNAYYVTYFVNEERFLNDIWIEGIGSTQTFLFNDVIRWGGSGYSYFNYFYNKNTQYIYPEDATLYDFGTSSTHEYIPYVQEGKVWVECDNQKNNWQVGIDGNVVMIDGIEYHTLQVESFNYWNNIVSSKTGSKLHGYIREEDKKVYVRELNSTRDNLIYDFGVQEGDTIDCADVVYDFDVRKECCIVVDSIKTATFYDKERKLYYVTCIEKFTYSDGREYPTYTSDMWVEGVGSIKLPIMSQLNDTHRWGASDRLEFKYFYDYNTQEVFPTTETPYSQFSYPGTTTDPEPEQKDYEYSPYVEEGKAWVDYDYMERYSQVGISGTTTIDHKEYHNLYIESFSLWGGNLSSKTDSKLHGYIREEDKKVYIRELNSTTEYLIYDFDVQVGDTINWETLTDNDNAIVIDSIKIDTYYGKERKLYYVTCIEKGPEGEEWRTGSDVWIEGVGSLEYPIMSVLDDRFRWGAAGMQYFKYCYNYNTQEIFPTTETPYSEFSYPGTTTDPEPEQKDYEYIPYVQEGNAWAFLNSVEMGVFQYSIGEMKEIDGKQYHIIYETFYNAMIGQAQMPREYGYIHEENGKVYCGTGDNERLIYDFTLQKGDSVYWGQEWYNSFGYDKYVYVKDVNYIQIAGKDRKVMTVETRGIVFSGDIEEGPDFDEIWIEGIGSTETVYANESSRWLTGLVGNYWRFSYYYNYPTQTSYPENATLYDFGFPTTDEYIPYVREGNAWVIIGGEGYKQFSIGQEVVIDNKSYYELNYAFFKPSKGCVTNRSLYDYIWEYDKKVYLGTETQNRLLYDFGAQVLDTIRYDHLDETFYYYTVVNSVSTQEILGKQRLVMNVSHYCSVDDFNDPIQSSWIEGIGAINEDIFDFEKSYRMGASATPDQFYYYTNSNEGGCYPEVQKVIDFSAISTINTDASTLTLHRSGDVLMATFPTVGKGEAITLYDATGRVVTTQPIREGATTTSIDVATLPDGIYIARLSNGSTAKVVL